MNRREIDWDRLDRYVAGEGTAEELEALRRWVESDPELQAVAQVLRTAQRVPDAGAAGWDARASWRAVAQRSGLPNDPAAEPAAHGPRARGEREGAPRMLQLAPGVARSRRPWRLAVLAAAAVVAAIGADRWIAAELGRRAAALPARAETGREYVAPRGQRLVVHLPDRTEITLAPETRLRLAPDYGRGARDVELQGHAYFVVTHDSTRPFSVRTDRLIARDLGTRFVVRAYPGDTVRAVIVAEGLVAMDRPSSDGAPRDTLLLEPGDLGRVTSTGDLARTRGVPVERYLAWTDGELRFRRTPLRDAVVELGRWYDVDLRLADPSLGGEEVTASFKDEPAPDAVSLIAAAAGLAVERNGTQFILRRTRD